MKTVRLLFNDQMARAIVEGRKTVTRRPILDVFGGFPPTDAVFRELHLSVPAAVFDTLAFGPGVQWSARMPCTPGDLLIGRECWRAFGGISDVRVDYRADGGRMVIGRESETVAGAHVHYLPDVSKYEASGNRWRPSIHMPDWAARIRRRVVSVTVEQVHDITEEDAVREGFPAGLWGNRDTRACGEFSATWDDIYTERGLGWFSNPWVWRIEFGAENMEGEQ